MNLDEYQKKAAQYDLFEATEDLRSTGFLEKILGLAGEAGEMVDKVKKVLRDKDGHVSEDDRVGVLKELGDVLWYTASVARYLGASLSEVAENNLEKLESRKQRDKLHGEGDDR